VESPSTKKKYITKNITKEAAAGYSATI